MGAPQQMLFASQGAPRVYATWNPLDKASEMMLSNGNLKVERSLVDSSYGSVRSTISKSSGKWYCEITLVAVGSAALIGVALDSAPLGPSYIGSTAAGWTYFKNGGIYNDGTLTAYGVPYGIGDIVGIAINMDAGVLEFYKNGVNQGIAFTGLAGKALYVAICLYNSAIANANFGATTFAYTVPSGYNPGLYV